MSSSSSCSARSTRSGETDWCLRESISKLANYSTDLVKEPIGLSAIHYDSRGNRLYFLASVEVNDKFGGYLWTMSRDDLFEETATPVLVHDQDGSPLRFQHKPEGLTSIGKDFLLVVHDDDRKKAAVETKCGIVTRQPHQSAYSVVNLR